MEAKRRRLKLGWARLQGRVWDCPMSGPRPCFISHFLPSNGTQEGALPDMASERWRLNYAGIREWVLETGRLLLSLVV